MVDESHTAEEIEAKLKAFKIFKKSFFQSNIAKYTTIVRIKFSNFRNEEECKKDKMRLYEESRKIAEIGIVYVDNPPIYNNLDDDDDQRRIEINKKRREKSRGILLKV